MSSPRRLVVFVFLSTLIAVAAATVTAQRQHQPAQVTILAKRSTEGAGTISARQLERVAERIAVAQALVNRFEREAKALGRASKWRQATLESLLSLPLTTLHRLQQEVHSADELSRAAAAAGSDPQVFGSTTEDLVYTPIVPCRFIDTRNIGGKITGTRGYDLALNGAAYGGDASCNPTALFGVTQDQFGALAMNVTIVEPSAAPGFVAIKPTPGASLSSLVNWYEAGPTVQTANQSIVTIDQNVGTTDEFVIEASASVHVIIDIFGAFLAAPATFSRETQTTTFAGIALNAGAVVSDLQSVCPTTWSILGGGCVTTTTDGNTILVDSRVDVHASYPVGSTTWSCAFRNVTPSTNVVIGLRVFALCGK